MKNTVWILACLMMLATSLASDEILFQDAWSKQGFTLTSQSATGVNIDFSLDSMTLSDIDINGRTMTDITITGVTLPNDEGAPNLPGDGRWIAMPEGAKASYTIVAKRVETFRGVDIAPAPRIPFENEDGPLEFKENSAIYQTDAFYPASPVMLSERTELRGVDAVILGVTPFQYNPVTRELRVYRDLQISVDFTGGNGQFGETSKRSQLWDPILQAAFINAQSLPEIDYAARTHNSRTPDYDYIILTSDRADYIAWAESLATVRNKQGVKTGVVTTTDIGGNTAANIEAYVDDAYLNWDHAPSAMLILGDYGTSTGLVTSPVWDSYCISDNFYADVSGNDLPDIAVARMTANNESQLEIMMEKAINYEYTPPTNPGFYSNPIIAGGWQTERWFILCAEVCRGFLANELGKTPVREYAIYSGTPGSSWSTATNTSTVVNFFGPNNLGYIPSTPGSLNDWGGNATRINADINSGAFMMLHRDHGSETGWGEPDYDKYDLPGLVDNDPIWVFSINCLTGKFNYTSETFAEAFHRYEDRALGITAATEVSYSFVNDTYVWGLMDLMWPEFNPDYGTAGDHNLLPAFANAFGKIFLASSSWPYNTSNKEVTYYLFHSHGDALTRLYEEVPLALSVTHANAVESGSTTFAVTANAGAQICLTVNDEIIGTGVGTGAPVFVSITQQTPPTNVTVTVTKQNYTRYEAVIPVAQSGPPQPNIFVSPLNIDYPDTPVGSSTVETFEIANAGNQPLTGTITTPTGYSVLTNRQTRNTLSFDIDEYTTETYQLVFEPTSVATYAGNVVISSNDPDEPTVNLAVTGDGYVPADITVSQSSLSQVMQQSQTAQQTLTIGNLGYETLVYQADIEFLPPSRDVLLSEGFENASVPPAGWSTEILSGTTDWELSASVSYSGGYSALADWNGCYDARLISPVFMATPDCQLSFWLRTQDSPSYGGDFDVEISTDGGATWTSLASWDQDTFTQTFAEVTLDTELQAYAGQDVQLSFRAWNNYWADGVYLDAITVTGTPYPTDWLTINGVTSFIDDVPYNQTDDILVDYDSANLDLGIYNANIHIQSNDPDEPMVTVPVTLTVSEGIPAISVSPGSMPFGIVNVGSTSQQTLYIDNPGTGTLAGTIITPDCYSVEEALPAVLTGDEMKEEAGQLNLNRETLSYSVAPGEQGEFTITFEPLSPVQYNGDITISNNVGGDEIVTVSGEGGQPIISVASDSIFSQQNVDTIVNKTLTVANTGTTPLNWTAMQAPDRANGRDLFGYTWTDSNTPGGPVYNWIDIVATGSPITLSDDDYLEVTLPFDFPFYGIDHNIIWISSNGYLTFGIDGTDFSNDDIPNATEPNDIICPFWDDLTPIGVSGGYDWGTVYYQIDAVNELLIVQYENVAHYSSSSPLYWETFEVIISSSGDMLFQYESLEYEQSCTVGIENADASDGVQIVNDAAYLTNGMAILVQPPTSDVPWLAISPESGVVQPGMSEDVTLTFDSAGLAIGDDFQTNVLVGSDDPNNPAILIPARLFVQFLPDPPANVRIEIVGDAMELSWDPVPDATTYTLYYSEDGVNFSQLMQTSDTNVTVPDIAYVEKLYIYVTAQ